MAIRIYFRIRDFAGGGPIGMSLDLGGGDVEIPYERLTANVTDKGKAEMLRMLGLDGSVSSDMVDIITPVEYAEEFGD